MRQKNTLENNGMKWELPILTELLHFGSYAFKETTILNIYDGELTQ